VSRGNSWEEKLRKGERESADFHDGEKEKGENRHGVKNLPNGREKTIGKEPQSAKE